MDLGIPNLDRADSKDIPVFKVLPITRTSFFFLSLFPVGVESFSLFSALEGNAFSVGSLAGDILTGRSLKEALLKT